MTVEFKGPNGSFVGMKKDGGDVPFKATKSAKIETVNNENYAGDAAMPSRETGSDKNNHTVHGKQPAEHLKLSGIHQPQIGGAEGDVAKEEKLNKPFRAFKYSREGRAMDNGSNDEQRLALGKDY